MTLRNLIFCLSLTSSLGHADWLVQPQAGLGYTSNANYEDTNEDSDFYLFPRNSSSFFRDRTTWNFWLSYKSYMEEKQEDAISRRRGVAQYSTHEENETQTLAQLKGSLVKMWRAVELTASALLNSQNSKSGFEDYTELSLLGLCSFTF